MEEHQKANESLHKLFEYCERLKKNELPKEHQEAHKKINAHFDHCLKVLEDRRLFLLKQVDITVDQQIKAREGEIEQAKKALDMYTKLFNSSCDLFTSDPELAKSNWQTIVFQEQPICTISVELPETLASRIENHGFVLSADKSHPTKQSPASQLVTINGGPIITIAGSSKGLKDGIGNNVKMNQPHGMVLNHNSGHFYFCDTINNTIRQVSTQGAVFSIKVESPWDLTWYQKENCFFVSSCHTIQRVSETGVTVIAGQIGQKGYQDGSKLQSKFSGLKGITVDQQTGNIYVCDLNNQLIRKITPEGIVSTLAGSPGRIGYVDGFGSLARFHDPIGITFCEKHQCLIICDTLNNKLRQVNIYGGVSTICAVERPIAVEIINDNTFLVSSFGIISKVTHQDFKQESISKEQFVATPPGKKRGRNTYNQIGRVYGMAVDQSKSTLYFTDCDANLIRKLDLKYT